MAIKDKKLKDYLVSKNLVEPTQLDAAERESAISKVGLGQTMVLNGFLSQDSLVDALITITDESLFEEDLIIPHVPDEIFHETRTKIVTQTVKAVYVSTMSDQSEVRYRLQKYFEGLEIKFTPANAEDIETYLDKLSNINDSEASILENLIRNAIMQGVSDIHIEPRNLTYTVFYRHLGVRRIIYEGDLEEYLQLNARIKDRSKMDLAERRIPQDGGFSIEYNGRLVDLRIATAPMNEGEKITIRILDPAKANNKITSIGISNLNAWQDGTSRSAGLCLICGPTGSGKTTTLNATIRSLNPFEKAIYTAEDPVEYSIPYVSQININEMVGLDFSRAVRAFMRADPDVIIVGEVRDIDTARNMVKAAETGHLVIATLHTESIHGAIDRLRDIGVDKHELKYILRSIMAQKLIRVLCQTCYGENKHCPHCFGSGYSGRTIISEANYFPDVKSVNELLNTDNITWETMLQDAYSKYKGGMTTYEEMFRIFGAEARYLIEEKGFSDRDVQRRKDNLLDIEAYR
jgi:type II secretory ATPase GspE/PulE/Tfp pilus assembly ATPase PilB-like protein